jgi:hypothetical protein
MDCGTDRWRCPCGANNMPVSAVCFRCGKPKPPAVRPAYPPPAAAPPVPPPATEPVRWRDLSEKTKLGRCLVGVVGSALAAGFIPVPQLQIGFMAVGTVCAAGVLFYGYLCLLDLL